MSTADKWDTETGGQGPDVTYRDVDSQMGEFARNVELNERLLQHLQEYELMLLDAANMPALLDVLLTNTATQFSLAGVSLRLYDPDDRIRDLMPADIDYETLTLESDSFDMQQLYGVQPEVELIGEDEPRITQLRFNGIKPHSAVLLPLVRDGNLVGSFEWASEDPEAFAATVELDFIGHLAAIIAICLENCANAERLSQLSLLDPLTRISNERAFEMELRKEISRAQRNQKGLSLIMLEVDEFKSVADNYGRLAADFTLKSVSEHLSNMLRSTDHLARCGASRFGLILPSCGESKAQEIAERMRSEIEFMEIDDRRGANLFASLSIGIVSWSPQSYPAINMEQLASQLSGTAVQGLKRSIDSGGNRVNLARLTAMMV